MHISPLTLIAALPLLAWIYMLAFRGGFWLAGSQTLHTEGAPSSRVRIAVVIPARNEAEVIARSVESLLQQQGEMRIYLVDDGSSDATVQIAIEAAQRLEGAADLRVIKGTPLPAGWTGKLWAMQQGIEQAREFNPDFVLLTDADIVHSPGSIEGLANVAQRGSFDLASLMVRLVSKTSAEKLLIPAFVFFFFMLYPPRWISNRRKGIAGAAGGCMLVRPEALDRVGGVASIRGEVIDDCSLAAAIKKSGGQVWLGLADASASIRPYAGFGEIGNMIARTAFSQLQHSIALLALSLVGLSLCFVLPIAMLFTRDSVAMMLGAGAWFAMAVCYLPMVRYYGQSPLWAPLLPASAVFYMGATVVSAVRYWTGQGGQWKGRAQDVRPSTGSNVSLRG